MQAQQRNIDIISNNISNINTPGYRIKRAEFSEVLYSYTQNEQANMSIATGYGTKITNVSTMPLPEDANPYGLVINGDGYFAIETEDGNRAYTQNGDFVLRETDGRNYLATRDGNYVLDKNFNRIEVSSDPELFIISGGIIFPEGNHGEQGIVPAIVKFDNISGQGITSREYFVETQYTGTPRMALNSSVSPIYADMLETFSNHISEIMKLSQTQMAYQINSRALQIIDEMEAMANHLRY